MSLTSPNPQWGVLIDLDEDFKPYVQYPEGKTDQDTVLELIVDATSTWIQEYLGRPIAPTTFFRRFDGWTGWGGSYIMLPYYPVIQIVSAVEWWGISGPHSLTEQTPENQGPGNQTYQIEPLTGRLIRTFPGLVQKPFFPGSRNIEVEWIAGYDPVPPQLRLAALELARHWYENTQEQPRIAGDMMHGGGEERDAFWPAVPNHVTMLLQPYLQIGIG